MGSIQLTTTLVPRGQAAAVVLDAGQVAAVGEGAKRFPVVATVNGYTWRTTVTRMRGEFLLGLNREVREGAGVNAGDSVEVEASAERLRQERERVARLRAGAERNAAELAAQQLNWQGERNRLQIELDIAEEGECPL